MSREYFGNTSRPNRGALRPTNPRASSGRGGRAPGAPQLHSLQQQAQPAPYPHGQNPTPEFAQYANSPAMGSGYGSMQPPPYYAPNFTQGPVYSPYDGPQDVPPMRQNPTRGWGDPNVFAPPVRMTRSEPHRRFDDAMEIDEPHPPRREPTRQPRVRAPRRGGGGGKQHHQREGSSRQPALSAGNLQPSTRQGKGKMRATEGDLIEQEREDREEQLNELLHRLDQADVDPTLADFMERDEIAQVVVRQLLDTIDGLRSEVDRERRARRDAETHLVLHTHKRPLTSPTRNVVDEDRRLPKRARNTDEDDSRAPRPEDKTEGEKLPPVDQPGTTAAPEETPITLVAPEATSMMEEVETTATKGPKRKPRKGEGQAILPITYSLPGGLPVAPTALINPSPDFVPLNETMLPSTTGPGAEDDTWDPIEGESKQQIQQRLAHNAKVKKKMAKKEKEIEEALQKRHHYNESKPGRIPNGMGIIMVGQTPERNNAFHGMLSRNFYYSARTNMVFSGQTAVHAARYKLDSTRSYFPDPHRRLYTVAPRGLPMNPREVRQLVVLVTATHHARIDRVEGFRLLSELRRLAHVSTSERRD